MPRRGPPTPAPTWPGANASWPRNAVSRRDFEEKQNAAREAAAALKAAQAALKVAELNLEYTRITAPISGRMSRAEVTVGNLVAPGNAAPLTTLVSADSIYAAFDVDEQSYLKYVSGSQGKGLPIRMGLADESGHGREGRLSSVDNRLDSTSGTIRLRAVFDNPDGRLVPGLYARVRLGSEAPREAVLVDEKAVGTDQDKRFVLVVDGKNQHRLSGSAPGGGAGRPAGGGERPQGRRAHRGEWLAAGPSGGRSGAPDGLHGRPARRPAWPGAASPADKG